MEPTEEEAGVVTVYVLIAGGDWPENSDIFGIYSTREKAEVAAAKVHKPWPIEEYELDA